MSINLTIQWLKSLQLQGVDILVSFIMMIVMMESPNNTVDLIFFDTYVNIWSLYNSLTPYTNGPIGPFNDSEGTRLLRFLHPVYLSPRIDGAEAGRVDSEITLGAGGLAESYWMGSTRWMTDVTVVTWVTLVVFLMC